VASASTGQEACLASGLRLVTRHVPGSTQLGVATVIDGGRAGDPEGFEGAAHLVEHLWFRSHEGDGPAVEGVLRGLGAGNNGFTRIDESVYVTRSVAEDTAALLSLEARRLADPMAGIEQADLDLEREIVRHELAVRGGEDHSLATEALGEALYPEGHPSRRFATQQQETLAGIELSALQDYADRWYRPEHATMLLVGDLPAQGDPNAVALALLPPSLRGTGQTRPCNLLFVTRSPPDPLHREMIVRSAYRADPTLLVAWSLPGGFGADGAALDVLGTSTAMLLRFGIYEAGLGSAGIFPSCSVLRRVEASELLCSVPVPHTMGPEQLRDTLLGTLDGVLFSAVARISLDDLIAEAVEEQQAWVGVQDAESAAATLSGLSREARSWHREGTAASLPSRLAALDLVGTQRVLGLARRYVIPERAVSVLLVSHELLPLDREETDALELPVGTSLALAPTPAFDPPPPPQIRAATLENGLPLYAIEGRNPSRSTAHLVVRGSTQHESLPGQQALASRMVSLFQGRWELRRRPLPLGGIWHLNSSSGHWLYGFEGPTDHLPRLFASLRELIDGVLFHTDDRRDVLKSQADPPRPSPLGALQAAVLQHMLPGHPLTRAWSEGTLPATLFQTARARRWFEGLIAPTNSALFVVGDNDPVALETLVGQNLGSWQGQGRAELPPPPPVPALDRQAVYVPGLGPRTIVQVAAPMPSDTVAGHSLRRVLQLALNDGVHDVIRWQRGWTYSPAVGHQVSPDGGAYLTMQVSVPHDRVPATITLLLEVLEGLAQEPLSADAVAQLDARAARQLSQTLHSDDGTLDLLEAAWLHGHDPDVLMSHSPVDPAALHQALQGAAGHEFIGVVGPPQVFEPLVELGHPLRVVLP